MFGIIITGICFSVIMMLDNFLSVFSSVKVNMNVIFHWTFFTQIVLHELPCILWEDNTVVVISRMHFSGVFFLESQT